MKKSLAKQLILKQCLFLLRMHEGTLIKSHIAEFFSIINDLNKIKLKIEDEDQTLLLLCFLPSLVRVLGKLSFTETSTIKINEFKEHLLNKDKIDNQLTTKSHCDDSG